MSSDIPFVCFLWVLRLSLPQAIIFSSSMPTWLLTPVLTGFCETKSTALKATLTPASRGAEGSPELRLSPVSSVLSDELFLASPRDSECHIHSSHLPKPGSFSRCPSSGLFTQAKCSVTPKVGTILISEGKVAIHIWNHHNDAAASKASCAPRQAHHRAGPAIGAGFGLLRAGV